RRAMYEEDFSVCSSIGYANNFLGSIGSTLRDFGARHVPHGESWSRRLQHEAASKSLDDVVRAGVFLTNMTDFAAMNGIYAKYFSQPFPARTMIAAAALPLGACVEIDLVKA